MKPASNNTTFSNRRSLSILLTIIPCVFLIAALSYPTATTVYPECKICKFIAHIYLGGIAFSQAITLPPVTTDINSSDTPLSKISSGLILTYASLCVTIVIAYRCAVALVDSTALKYRAPPVYLVR